MGSYTVGKHFEKYIKAKVESGRFSSESEVIRDALRQAEDKDRQIAEENEMKLAWLRHVIQEAIDDPVSYTSEELDVLLQQDEEELEGEELV